MNNMIYFLFFITKYIYKKEREYKIYKKERENIKYIIL